MKRILILFSISLIMIYISGCKKEIPDYEQKGIFLSTELWLPGVLYSDDEFYYWLDPELCEEPIAPTEIWKGPANQDGRSETYTVFENGREIVKERIICFDVGTICGIQYRQNADGTYTEAGKYLKRN